MDIYFYTLRLESTIIEKGYTRKGGATEFLQGFDVFVTLLAQRLVDGAARLCLAGLGIDEDPAWFNPAVDQGQLVITIAFFARCQDLGGPHEPGQLGLRSRLPEHA